MMRMLQYLNSKCFTVYAAGQMQSGVAESRRFSFQTESEKARQTAVAERQNLQKNIKAEN